MEYISVCKYVERTFVSNEGRIQDFKLGGAHSKKLRRAEGGAKIVGVFRVKNHDFTPKNHIFSNFRGARPRGAPPPGSAPGNRHYITEILLKVALNTIILSSFVSGKNLCPI
jgi:hypothetical protein